MTYKCSALILTGKPEVTWDIEVLYKIIFHSNNLQFKISKIKTFYLQTYYFRLLL